MEKSSGIAYRAITAFIGALNTLDGVEHRRDALWQVERAGKPEGPLLMQQSQWLREETGESPLAAMTPEERLVADYAVNNLGLNLAQMGNQAQAEQAFRTSIRLMPYDAAAQANLGQLLAGRGDLRQSAFHLEKTVRFDAKQANSRYVYAAVLAQLNQFDGAQLQVEAAIAINPEMPQAHDLYGLILLQDGSWDAAKLEFRRALKLNPSFSPSHLHLAMSLIQTGDRVGALAELRIASSSPDPGIAQQARDMEIKLEGH